MVYGELAAQCFGRGGLHGAGNVELVGLNRDAAGLSNMLPITTYTIPVRIVLAIGAD